MSKTKKAKGSKMLVPTIIMGMLALILIGTGYFKGGGEYLVGLKSAFNMTVEILPLLIFAFTIAGMVQVLLPREFLVEWVGEESGFRGIPSRHSRRSLC